jgi:hypothetical protein
MHLAGCCTPAIRTGRRRRKPWKASDAAVLHALQDPRSSLCKECCARGFPVAGHVKPPFVRR